MAVPVYESSFPNGAAVDAALGLAETSLQPGADLANLASGAATVGQVPAADGSGGVDWADLPDGPPPDLNIYRAIAFGGF